MTDRGVGLDCPSCPPGTPLEVGSGPLSASVCQVCDGALVAPRFAEALRPTLAAASPWSRQGPIACPSCHAQVTWVRLAGGEAAPCRECGVVWLSKSVLAAPSTRPPRRKSLALALAAAGLSLAVAAGGAWFALRRDAPPRSPRADARAADNPTSPPAAAAPAAPKAPAATAAPATPPAPEALIGGRLPGWWEERLRTLAARTDDEGKRLFEATRARAEANGLVVADAGGKLGVSPGPALQARLAEEAR